MDEIKRAMLGDKEAQIRVTEREELLPCPYCKGKGKVSFKNYKFFGQNDFGDKKIVYRVQVICNKCKGRGKPIFTEPLINPKPYISKWGNNCTNTEICIKATSMFFEYVKVAIREWNTRPQILTDEEMERLEGME